MAAAILGKTEVGVKEFGRDVEVPENATAKLMYYLDSICYVLNIEKTEQNIRKLRDYKNYRRLSESEVNDLVVLCILFSPDVLLGKCIFPEEEMCGMDMNKFYELSAVSNRFLISEEILIGGQTRRVQKILCFRDIWLECFYLDPIKQFQSRIESIAGQIRQRSEGRQPRAITDRPSTSRQTELSPPRSQTSASYRRPEPQMSRQARPQQTTSASAQNTSTKEDKCTIS